MNIFDSFNQKLIYKKEFLTNEYINKKNDLCSSIYFIKRGKVALLSNGKIISIYNQNSIIGLDIIFSNNPFYKHDYISLELTSTDVISKDGLFEEFKNKESSLKILNYYSNQILELKEHISLLSYKNDKDKVINYLYSEYKNKSSTSFVINMTKAELADYLNIKKNELSNIIKQLINDKIIANQNRLYTIINLNYFLDY